MRIWNAALPFSFLLVAGACSPAPSSPSPAAGTNGAPDGGSSGGPGGGDGGGVVDGTVKKAPVIKSSCAPADVTLGAAKLTTMHAGSYYKGMAVADFNLDGKMDLAMLESDGVEVFISNGDGTFKATFFEGSTGNGHGIVAGDFHGNGSPSVLASASGLLNGDNNAPVVGLYAAKGDGNLGAIPIGVPTGTTNMLKLEAADLNGDGKLDLVYDSQTGGGNGGVVLGSGGAAFGGPRSIDMASVWTVGDLNGDGAADIIGGPPDGNHEGLCIKMNNGGGQFGAVVCQPGPIAHGGSVYKVAVGDINGDGKLDAVGIYDGSSGIDGDKSNIAIYIGKGDGTFEDRKLSLLKVDMQGAILADVNNDGKADFVAFAHDTDASSLIHVLLAKGDGTFEATPLEYAAGRIQSGSLQNPVVGDFGGNGLRGILVHNSAKSGFDVMMATCKK